MSSKTPCDNVRDFLFSRGAVGGGAGRLPDCVQLDDLTTAGTFPYYTNEYDWGGSNPNSPAYRTRLHARDTVNPTGVPGLQVEGYFSDENSKTTRAPSNFYGNKKYRCDSQFVIRFPDQWNGRLVITGAPGVRGQYANDFLISDFVLGKGYAFASTDKGNSGLQFYRDDETPGAAIQEWNHRIKQLTETARVAAETYYGEEPERTYITGTSTGVYLTRYALEKHPELYDGGVDWQGALWTDHDEPTSDRDKGPNLLTFLPWTLRYYPQYRDAKSQAAHDVMIFAGFEPGSEFLWQYHYETYWNSTQRIYREEFDPYWPGSDAEYDYAGRLDPGKNPFAQVIKNAVKQVSLRGDIQRPLLTLHGTLNALLPITKTSNKYAELVKKAGR